MKGFRFNINRCVACNACAAGCYLENGGAVSWRRILHETEGDSPGLPVHNISIACNHCSDAPCITGCPANAYNRDSESGAVLVNGERCIGCNYCFWNCPYDAPQYNQNRRVVEKCTLCVDRVNDGNNPACVSACPTGALTFDLIKEEKSDSPILRDPGIGAQLNISGTKLTGDAPRVVPEPASIKEKKRVKPVSKINTLNEWSLILFTFLISILFALNISQRVGDVVVDNYLYLGLIVLTLILPIIHLGKPFRAWRSVSALFISPLSTEIFFLLLFSITSIGQIFFPVRSLWIASFIMGLLLLISVDNVYSFSDKRLKTHSGQIFLIGLIVASLFIGELLPFLFIALIKVIALWYRKENNSRSFKYIHLSLYIVILLLTSYTLISGNFRIVGVVILILSEFLNRLLYYHDFNPESVLSEFYYKNIYEYEDQKIS